MRQFVVVAAITLIGFAAGSAAGMWYERHRPLPPPPVPFMGEFHGRGPRNASQKGKAPMPINRADLIKRIASLQPQLESFQHGTEAIDRQFDRDFDLILNPDQKAKHAQRMDDPRRHREKKKTDSTKPLSDDQINFMMRDQADWTVVSYVVIPFRLDYLTREYKLDDDQREKTRVLLRTRRGQFFELVDSSPPPSVNLSRLAQLAQRLGPVPGNEPPPAYSSAATPPSAAK